jgi:glutamate synthase domain-containing protein 1
LSPLEEFRSISGCGILGMLRKAGAPRIRAEEALCSIECVRYRGSKYGAGFAAYNVEGVCEGLFKVKAFVRGEDALLHVKKILSEYAGGDLFELGFEFQGETQFLSWAASVQASVDSLRRAVDKTNYDLLNSGIKGRIYSWGRYVEVFKGVGYPADVARLYGLVERDAQADMWIAHTRQPTNSPGIYPIWSHPFSSYEWAIAHNGDISSFGANMEFMRYRGVSSFVGTDSELIVYILDYLTSIAGLPVEKAALALVNPFENTLVSAEHSALGLGKYIEFRGAWLDGPFSVVAGYCDGEDVYMLALADRSKFRPLVVGEDGARIYVASEEAEIRALSEDADVWPVKPGGVFLASMKRGIILRGREHVQVFYRKVRTPPPSRGLVIDASGMSYSQINRLVREYFQSGAREVTVKNVNGHRYLGINVPPGCRLNIYGTAGNCLANFNKGGEIIVYGSAQDDVGDAMYGGRVVIHGDARDVIAQALQGGEIFVRGSVGNRAGIQMREFRDSTPFLIIGGRADDYLGEYMAGGVAMVLGIDAIDLDECLVGRYVATGMVGGRIYVRGRVERWRIGLPPPKLDVLRYLKGLYLEGLIDYYTLNKLESTKGEITLDDIRANLSGEPLRRVSKLFTSKYHKDLKVEERQLGDWDLKLVTGPLWRFFTEFGLDQRLYQRILESEFTIIETAQAAAKREQHVEAEEG